MAPPAQAAPPAARRRNRRGEGDRLREEIITAASQMIGEAGDDSALTLRGVARRVGIAAPSIYRHFTDVDELKMAVVSEASPNSAGPATPPVRTVTTRPRACWPAAALTSGSRTMAGIAGSRLCQDGPGWPQKCSGLVPDAALRRSRDP